MTRRERMLGVMLTVFGIPVSIIVYAILDAISRGGAR